MDAPPVDALPAASPPEPEWWLDLAQRERSVYSQLGEEGILDWIIAHIPHPVPYAIEIGAGDGGAAVDLGAKPKRCRSSTTRSLRNAGWRGLMIDAEFETKLVRREIVTAENVNRVFARHGVPDPAGVLSIDIDGNDYWIWKALRWRAQVVLVEFNGQIPYGESVAVTYDPAFRWDGTVYYGASFTAFQRLGERLGYTLIHQQREQNLYFILSSLLPPGAAPEVRFEAVRRFPDHPWVEV